MRQDLISNQVRRLIRDRPSLAEIDKRMLLLLEYWSIYDNMHYENGIYYVSRENLGGLTSAESITRALRKLIEDGIVKPSTWSKNRSVELETEYKEQYR